MDIDEVRDEQAKLSSDILELVTVFEKKAGISISDIRVERAFEVSARLPVTVQIHITSTL